MGRNIVSIINYKKSLSKKYYNLPSIYYESSVRSTDCNILIPNSIFVLVLSVKMDHIIKQVLAV